MSKKSNSMDAVERQHLLGIISEFSSDTDGIDTSEDFKAHFLPLRSHAAVLMPGKLIIRGGRGAGKTALFRILKNLESAEAQMLFPKGTVEPLTWIDGFSEAKIHPDTEVLNHFGEKAEDKELREFWYGHLIGILSENHPDLEAGSADSFLSHWKTSAPKVWVSLVAPNLDNLVAWLDRCDDFYSNQEKWLFVAYDNLDKIGILKSEVRERFAAALTSMWLSLANRYDRIRCKIFIREDLFQASLSSSADASKLQNRAISLDWNTQDLFRVLIRRMAVDDDLRGWLTNNDRPIELTEKKPFGWFPPEAFPEEGTANSQKKFAEKLVGSLMGAGVNKGYTHRWIPNHLQDTHGDIVPRAMLNLISFAAAEALKGPLADGQRLLEPQELQKALEATSKARATELAEEYPVVLRLEHLRDHVMLDVRKNLTKKLWKPSSKEDGFGRDGGAVFDELVRLGVFRVRTDQRVDVADIYRFGYGIKRKGGLARPK
ncbi:MAG: hypothetical protein GY822_23320 [Deltaproteobacteria bacterium]|nr:hypothetical protein [Deltaproteobacteria bacterium]